jgi:hypothetical protein
MTRGYDSRNYPKNDNQFGGLQLAHHEQSETTQNDKGKWINTYGQKTPKAGQQLPDTPEYDSVDDAVSAAKQRSEDYGKQFPEHTDEE